MTRDEALELLPLLAGGELDEVTAAAAQRAAEEDPTLMAELESYRALDAALTTAYAPEASAPETVALAVAEPARPQRVVVRRRCPYCHDAIQAEALVVCAACATPHHAPCFEANEGCSLLGCGSQASIAASGPASVVCGGCARSTPQGAPFCAWCGAGLEVEAAPRHARPREEAPFEWRRYAAAAALLVASTFGVGGLFGAQQAALLDGAAESAREQRSEREREAAEQLVRETLTLQDAYRRERGVWARSFEELRGLRPRSGRREDDPVAMRWQRVEAALATLHRRFVVELRSAAEADGRGLPPGARAPVAAHSIAFRAKAPGDLSFVVDDGQRVHAVRGAFTVDPVSLEVHDAAGAVAKDTPLADWRSLWWNLR